MSHGILIVSELQNRKLHSGEDVPQQRIRLPPSNGDSAAYPNAFSKAFLPMFARKPLPPWALTMCWPLCVFMIATPMSSAKSALFFHAVLVHSWLALHVPHGRGLARSSS